MMDAKKGPSREITGVERKENAVFLYSEYATHRIMAVNEKTIRITMTREKEFSKKERPGIANLITPSTAWGTVLLNESEGTVLFATSETMIKIDKKTASYTYYDLPGTVLLPKQSMGTVLRNESEGTVLLQEREKESKVLDPFETYRLSGQGQVTEKVQTPDGIKEIIREATKEKAGKSYHAFHYFEFGDEALYGLGQHEEGYGNLRGKKLYVHQANRKIAVPMLVSTKGYGIMTDTYSAFIFNDATDEPYMYQEAVSELDFYFMNGKSMQGVLDEYRKLTGKATMLPKWAYGFVQSKERYESAEDILKTVDKSRKAGVGMDCIVLDWMSWEDGKWGQKTFDRKRFNNPAEMIAKLHKKNVHFMISIWPSTSENCENRKDFEKNGVMLKNCGVYDAFSKKGREVYWKQLEEDIWPSGVDAFWCDSSEPITPEWSLVERPEEAKAFSDFNNEMCLRTDAEYSDAFCLYHAMGIYEGQRASGDGSSKGDGSSRGDGSSATIRGDGSSTKPSTKRVVNLTRSATTGQQRYGTIMWSGDIDASWKTLRRQTGAGLNFCASGIPYWTFDIGAFFVKPGNFWYWNGEFENPEKNLGYRELYTRWYQLGVFMPMFRAHGTDISREIWNFGKPGEMFYDAQLKANRLRYELMPYIYSQAGKVWLENKNMIGLLSFSFAKDKKVWDITDQFMFGDSIMVCPVMTPMYYDEESNPIKNVELARNVYLPKGNLWYDFYTGECFKGGQTITVSAPIDVIPLFVKNKSIIPMSEASLTTFEQKKEIRYKVFSNASCDYIRYDDAGDGYGYEVGEYDLYKVHYDGKTGEITEKKLARHIM